MTSRLLLVLDDDRARLHGFEQIARRLGSEWQIKTWRDARAMAAELHRHLDAARLISLDHDLYSDSLSDPDPGSGRVIADYLAARKASCPVIVHSTNTDAAWGMHNALRRGGWTVELVHHLSQPKWIEEVWLPAAVRLVTTCAEPDAPARGASINLDRYRAIVRALPAATPQHLRAFADYVAGAHSWYKHLRLLPASAPLQVYLDPGAGMQRIQSSDGGLTVAPREERGFHYSWLATAEHRKLFGYLAFSKSAGSTVSLTAPDGVSLVPADDAPRIYDPATRALVALPDEALLAGRVFISGIIHRRAADKHRWQRAIAKTERFDGILERSEGLDVAKRIFDRCQLLKDDPSRAEPEAGRAGDVLHEVSLAAFDVPLHRLVAAERERQIEGIAAAAARVLKLVRA